MVNTQAKKEKERERATEACHRMNERGRYKDTNKTKSPKERNLNQ